MSVDHWHKDLTYLHQKLEKRHSNLYHDISKEDFSNGINELKELSGKIDDKELIVRISELVAIVKDAHTWLHPGYQEKWLFERLPINFDYFEDGLFIIEADENYKHLIGSKLISINGNPVKKVISKVKLIGYNENEFTQLLSITRFIVYPAVLKRFGFINDKAEVSLELQSKKSINKVIIRPLQNDSINWIKFTKAHENLPVIYKNNDSIYWSEYLPKENLFYIQLNSCRESDTHTFSNLSNEIIAQTERNEPNKLVLDLRRNVGGNSKLTFPLIYALMHYEKQLPNSQIFIITGRWTLSASIVLCAEIQKFCNPIFVGEPTGARANLFGENGYKLTLPYSGLQVAYASAWFQPSGPFVKTPWIPSDIYIPITSEHYFNLKQPILEVIKRYSKPKEKISEIIFNLAMKDSIQMAMQVYKDYKTNTKNKYVDTSNEIRRMATQLGRNGKLEYCKIFYELNSKDYPENTLILVNLAQLVEEDFKDIKIAKELYAKILTLLKFDNQTNDYLKHYIEDYANEKLKVLD
jgi:hypothetical protein